MATRKNARQIKKAEQGRKRNKKRELKKRISIHHPKNAADVIALLREFKDCIEVLDDGRVKYYKLEHKGVKYTYNVYKDGDFSLFIVDGIATAAAIHARGNTIYGSYEFKSTLDFIDMDKCVTEERFFQRSLIEDTGDYTAEDLRNILAEYAEIRARIASGTPITR